MAWTPGSAVSYDYLPRIFFFPGTTPFLRPTPSSVSLTSMDTYGLLSHGNSLVFYPDAGYNQIPASCLIMVGMNTKRTLLSRWEEAQPRRKLYLPMSLAL